MSLRREGNDIGKLTSNFSLPYAFLIYTINYRAKLISRIDKYLITFSSLKKVITAILVQNLGAFRFLYLYK